MTNNKQQTAVKLYTEEQLTRYLLDEGIMELSDLANNLVPHTELPSDSLCINCDESKSTHNVCMDCIIKIGGQNIQIPTDEEIKKESKYKSNYILPQAVQFNPILNIVWIEGAKWMRDKIQGGEQ